MNMKEARYGATSPEYIISITYFLDIAAMIHKVHKIDVEIFDALRKSFQLFDTTLPKFLRRLIINYIVEYIDKDIMPKKRALFNLLMPHYVSRESDNNDDSLEESDIELELF